MCAHGLSVTSGPGPSARSPGGPSDAGRPVALPTADRRSLVRRRRRVGLVALALTFVFGAGMLVPALLGADMMQGGFAAAAGSAFLALVALIVAVLYLRLAGRVSRLLAGEDLLVSWTYPPEEWRAAVEGEAETSAREKRTLWFVVLGFCVLIGGIFWIADPEAGPLVALILLGVATLTGIVAFGASRVQRRRQQREVPATWIGRRGALVGGAYHDWSGAMSALRGVEATEDELGRRWLHLTYHVPARHGGQLEEARIPVPKGREDEALGVARELAAVVVGGPLDEGLPDEEPPPDGSDQAGRGIRKGSSTSQ